LGKYQTQFQVIVFDNTGNRFEPGSVKIGHVGLLPSKLSNGGNELLLSTVNFDALAEGYFSLGQGEITMKH
jgi:hypothetical protein